jgi:hypothetical protein
MDSAAVKSVIAIPVAKRDFMILPPVHTLHFVLLGYQQLGITFSSMSSRVVPPFLDCLVLWSNKHSKTKKREDSLESSPWVLLRLKGGALCLLQTSYRPDELDVLAEAAPADFGMLK